MTHARGILSSTRSASGHTSRFLAAQRFADALRNKVMFGALFLQNALATGTRRVCSLSCPHGHRTQRRTGSQTEVRITTMSAYRRVTVVSSAQMEDTALFQASVSPRKQNLMMRAVERVCSQRIDYEAQKERMIGGVLQVGQSPDIRFVEALIGNESYARLLVAIGANPRELIHPDSVEGGKQSDQTSNLKSYNKQRQIAETIFTGNSDLEGVARVFAVCAYRFATSGRTILTREWCENFLSSREFASIDVGTADLWSNIDDIRAKQMTGGAATQSGQMVRTLVALKSATDVREGRAKNVQVNPEGLVMQALMTRLGQMEVGPRAPVVAE